MNKAKKQNYVPPKLIDFSQQNSTGACEIGSAHMEFCYDGTAADHECLYGSSGAPPPGP